MANQTLKPMREKYNYYKAHKQEVVEILNKGAIRARELAQKVLSKVRENIGVNF